jgi:hypothetical protein
MMSLRVSARLSVCGIFAHGRLLLLMIYKTEMTRTAIKETPVNNRPPAASPLFHYVHHFMLRSALWAFNVSGQKNLL